MPASDKPKWTPEMIDALSAKEVVTLMQSESPLNKGRRAFSACRSQIEASRKRDQIDIRKQEFKAVILILRALFAE